MSELIIPDAQPLFDKSLKKFSGEEYSNASRATAHAMSYCPEMVSRYF